jgi:cell division protein FtsA
MRTARSCWKSGQTANIATMVQKNKIVAGLDVGTTQIRALIAEENEEGEIKIIGVGAHRSLGLKKGEIVNPDQAIKGIEKALDQVEQISGFGIKSAFVGITGGHVQSFNSRSLFPVARPRLGVSPRDVEKAIKAAQAIAIPSDQEIIHIIPQEFAVDNQKGIVNPEGMLGSRLEAKIHVITGSITGIQNVARCVNRAGVEVEDIVFQPLAASLAVLRQEEQKSGVLLLNLGGGTTDYVLFQDEVIRSTGVLNVGGGHVTNDVSIGLKLLQSQAEEVKKKFGFASSGSIDERSDFSIPAIMGRAATKIFRKKLCHIIELRLTEILSLIEKDLLGKNVFHLGSGIVLSGGGSLLGGIAELAEEKLGLPARTGKPWGITGFKEIIDNPGYATAAGLLKYGFQYRGSGGSGRLPGSGKFWQAAKSFRNWIQKYF